MFKTAILTFICYILFVTGKPNLIFLEGTKNLVSSVKIIRNGTNVTVTCIIEDLKNRRESSDLIFWINDDLSRQRSETNSITLYKPGTYYCICDKYKLVRRLNLVVRNEDDFERRKRSQHEFSMPRYTDILPINYTDPVRDIFEDSLKTTSNTNNDNVNVDLEKYLADLKKTFNNNYDQDYRGNLHSIYQGPSKTTSNTNNDNVNDDLEKYLADLQKKFNNYRDNVPSIYQGIPITPHTDVLPKIYPDPARDFFEVPSKTTSNTNNKDYIDKYLANSAGGSIVNNNNKYGPNYRDNMPTIYQDSGVRFESNNDESHPIYVPQHKDGFNVIYFFAIVLAFVVISLLIYCLSKRRNEAVTNARTNDIGITASNITASNTNNQIEYCSHIFCERYRNTNPELSCYLANLNSSGHIPLSTINHDDGGVTILTSLIRSNDTIDGSSVRPYSDSPPAYGFSTRNSPLQSTEDVPTELDLPPPSYNQAVANMNLDPPPDFDSSVDQMPVSTTSTSLPNVTRTEVPLERP